VEDAEEVMTRVGQRIAELREAAGLTQAETAERVEMTVSNYQRVEHGLQNLTIRTMVTIAQVLEVTVAQFFEPTRSRKRPPGRPRKAVRS
jgi:transcriptional regulator with XRE-family HTH domain